MTDKSTKTSSKGTGYKKPPMHSQWKKGQSGNPSGKPKKEPSLNAKLKNLAAKEIVVTENGKKVSMTQDEAMLVAVLMKAMKGDMAAVKFVFEQLGAGEEALLSPPAMKLGPEDMEVLNNRITWLEIRDKELAEIEASAPLSENMQEDTENGSHEDY